MPVSASISTSAEIDRAAAAIARSRRLLVLTGAGLSADAGVPTFRCEGGLWRSHNVADLATPEGFARDPETVWDWYRERRLVVAGCQPHTGQRALALLERHFHDGRVLVATTNEDDLLERAGVERVLHLHGSLFDTVCAAGCGWNARDTDDNSLSLVPCPRCGGAVRPGSVWFGEPLPQRPLEAISAFDPDACLLVGSSCIVQPAAAIPAELALAGRPVVEVNPEPTGFSDSARVSLRGTARDLLPPLVDLLTSRTIRDQRRRIT